MPQCEQCEKQLKTRQALIQHLKVCGDDQPVKVGTTTKRATGYLNMLLNLLYFCAMGDWSVVKVFKSLIFMAVLLAIFEVYTDANKSTVLLGLEMFMIAFRDGHLSNVWYMLMHQMQCLGFVSVSCHVPDYMRDEENLIKKELLDDLSYTSCVDFDGYLELIYKECGLGTAETIKKVQTKDYSCTSQPPKCPVIIKFAKN